MRTPLQLAWLIILVTRAHLVASTCAPVLIFASTIIYIFVRFICLSTAYVHIFTHKDPIFLQVDISNCLLAQLRLGLLRHPFFHYRWIDYPRFAVQNTVFLVVLSKTPLKNDGLKVSWDDEIHNMMGKINQKNGPNHQPDTVFDGPYPHS